MHYGQEQPRIAVYVLTIEPLSYPFAHSQAPLTHSCAPHCLLCLRALLRSFICLLAHSLPSKLGKKLIIICWDIRLFWTIVHRSHDEIWGLGGGLKVHKIEAEIKLSQRCWVRSTDTKSETGTDWQNQKYRDKDRRRNWTQWSKGIISMCLTVIYCCLNCYLICSF